MTLTVLSHKRCVVTALHYHGVATCLEADYLKTRILNFRQIMKGAYRVARAQRVATYLPGFIR